jgi:hypothetical protein
MLICWIGLAQGSKGWEFGYKPFSGEYVIYGGGLGDPYAPTGTNSQIAFSVKGPLAKQMFDAMEPDLKDVCGAGPGVRVREKDAVSCRFNKGDGYSCDFGFDLKSGKSIGGSVC